MSVPHILRITTTSVVEHGKPQLILHSLWDDHCEHTIKVSARADHTFDKQKVAHALHTLADAVASHE